MHCFTVFALDKNAMQKHNQHCKSDLCSHNVTVREIQYILLIDQILPLEASSATQGNSHQSKKQEELHVGSEADLAPGQLL